MVPVYTNTWMLKYGETVHLRMYRPEDKEHLISYYGGLSKNTLRWALPPYDRIRIERWVSDPDHSIILLALHHEKIVGHLQVFTQNHPRFKDMGELLIYLTDLFQNQGLGTIMVREAISLARERGLHRIGLTVVADNKAGIRAYEKAGFEKEGIRRHAYYGDDDQYHDQVEMGILL